LRSSRSGSRCALANGLSWLFWHTA
jgi:hypothetical protein